MDWKEVLGLIGAAVGILAAGGTMLAVLFRAGSSLGAMEARVEHVVESQDTLTGAFRQFAAENREEHATANRVMGEMQGRVFDLTGRVGVLEGANHVTPPRSSRPFRRED